ncbi:hypothetical protein Tco_0410136 [Tanacetum coccineum]
MSPPPFICNPENSRASNLVKLIAAEVNTGEAEKSNEEEAAREATGNLKLTTFKARVNADQIIAEKIQQEERRKPYSMTGKKQRVYLPIMTSTQRTCFSYACGKQIPSDKGSTLINVETEVKKRKKKDSMALELIKDYKSCKAHLDPVDKDLHQSSCLRGRMIFDAKLKDNTTIAELVNYGAWSWPYLSSIQVLHVCEQHQKNVLLVDNKGREGLFLVKRVWKDIRSGVVDDNYRYMGRIKFLDKIDDDNWADIIQGVARMEHSNILVSGSSADVSCVADIWQVIMNVRPDNLTRARAVWQNEIETIEHLLDRVVSKKGFKEKRKGAIRLRRGPFKLKFSIKDIKRASRFSRFRRSSKDCKLIMDAETSKTKKHAELKSKSFEEIQVLYERYKKQDQTFVAIGTEEDERAIKRMNEKPTDKEEVKKDESVHEEVKEAEEAKKRKLGTRRKEDLKHYDLVMEDFYIKIDFLEGIDQNALGWKLHSSSGVHTIMTSTGLVFHMLVERRYPLTKEVLSKMLELKLETEEENSKALELIKL